jgi:multicopper oxidase
MKSDGESSDRRQARTNPSRRDFLRNGALAGASLAPGIAILSASARGDAAASLPTAEYELSVGTREARPDGRNRIISCYNGHLPGPLIRAKVGQKLRIKVVNHLSTPTSVHWHGLHQPGTWQMDGVDKVSRAPIAPGASFVYEFAATPAGTHWYHSHVGVQYGDGLFGPLVIEEATPPAKYDREEILVINDWFLRPADEILAGLLGEKPTGGSAKRPAMKPGPAGMPMAKMSDDMPMPASKGMTQHGMNMKGMGGKLDIGDVPFESALFNGLGRFRGTKAPLATLHVNRGETVRLRLINASSTYAFRFRIDGHRLTVIASDGAPIVPITVDNLVFSPGERYDVLLTADQSGSAWIRAATLAGDEARAVLRYSDAPNAEPAASVVSWGKQSLELSALRSPAPVTLDPNPRTVPLRLGGTMRPYSWNINGENYPRAEPIAAANNEWLRFVLDNPTGMDHPFHLHGHYFYVLGSPDKLNRLDPPLKDTVNVPAGRQLVLLWKANNPGRWFFHCHIEWHVATGMARVIEIAER